MAMGSYYLWLKGLHIAFMVTWFAGLFYLPRLFIYHAEAADPLSRERFSVMEFRLFVIMTIGAILTTVFGLLSLTINTALLDVRWFQAKVILLIGLFFYHYRCYAWIGRLRSTEITQPSKWLRWFNEVPVIFLLGIILLAVVKP